MSVTSVFVFEVQIFDCGGGGSGVSTLTDTLLRGQLYTLRAELSHRMAIIRVLFGGTSVQFSALTVLFYIPSSRAQTGNDLNTSFLFFDNSHSSGCEMLVLSVK